MPASKAQRKGTVLAIYVPPVVPNGNCVGNNESVGALLGAAIGIAAGMVLCCFNHPAIGALVGFSCFFAGWAWFYNFHSCWRVGEKQMKHAKHCPFHGTHFYQRRYENDYGVVNYSTPVDISL